MIVILAAVVLVFSRHGRAFPYLPNLIAAQYAQALLLWSEPRYLVPFYPFLIVLALTWYIDRYRARFGDSHLGSYQAGQAAAFR